MCKPNPRRRAVTLVEMLIVVLIISILSTIATGVYTGETKRARVAAAKSLIHQLDQAITRYELDTGMLPPSGTGSSLPPTNSRANGSGYLHLALVHSLSGNSRQPASALWRGPYINLQAENTNAVSGSTSAQGSSDILDPWQGLIYYVNHTEYTLSGGTFAGGTRMFESTAPSGANPSLPAPNPFAESETFYNASTYQLYCFGANGVSLGSTSVGGIGSTANYAGAEADDVSNFGY